MRLRRTLLNISQEELGRALGITFQQVQKYENAANRISASRLYDVANALDVPINFFFDGLPDPPRHDVSIDLEKEFALLLKLPETQDLVAAYHAIPSTALRKSLRGLIEEAANAVEDAVAEDAAAGDLADGAGPGGEAFNEGDVGDLD